MSEKESAHKASTDINESVSVEDVPQGNLFKRFIAGFEPVEMCDTDTNLTKAERAILATTQVPLQRKLKNRHIQMIAIGGSIGAGLFIASGTALKRGGPAGVLIAYLLIGVLLFCTMTTLGELGVRYPVNGVFSAYTSRFLDRSWGFALGWSYAIGWLLTMPTELVAASVTIGYWASDGTGAATVNHAAWISLFYAVILGINLCGVRGYGEAEVFFSTIKVLTVIGFIILGIVLTCGGGPDHTYIGSKYWHDPGSFAHGAKGVFRVIVQASYAFSGTEFAGLAAAETASPHLAIPKAVRQVFFRILIFYVVSVVLIGCLVPYTDSRLGTASNASASPFVIAITNAGIKGLPSVINVVIILAVLSVANAAIFGSTRTLVSLAAQGHAPKFLMIIDRKGRPLGALAVAFVFGFLGYIGCSSVRGKAFTWLSSIGGLSGLLTWGSVCAAHWRNRIAMKRQGVSVDELEYAAPGGIIPSIIGTLLTILLLGLQFWVALFPMGSDGADVESFFESYLSAFIILILFIGHKLFNRELWVKIDDIDVHTGIRVPDREILLAEKAEHKAYIQSLSWPKRIWNYWC